MTAPRYRAARSLGCLVTMGALLAQGPDDPALTEVDRRVLQELTAVRVTPRAVFHFAPDSIDAATLGADIDANVAALEGLERTLAMSYRGSVHVFLYRDGAAMKRLAQAPDGTVAFSTGTVSVHQPHDFRGVHEFVHIYALQFERLPDTAGPDLFATEGLATWFAESDEGIPIHEWAACYAQAGALPPLRELRRTFPEGAQKGVHPYHVAGSFTGFLAARFGLAALKRWYMDSTEAHAYFGANQTLLERQWREFLATVTVAAAHQDHVFGRLGRGAPMPAAWRAAQATPLFDGKSLRGLVAEDDAKWQVRDGVLACSNDAPWTHLATERACPVAIGVRARLTLRRGDAVKVRLPGGKEAIFATWSSFVSVGDSYSGNDQVRIAVGQPVEIVAVNDHGRARVYLNGIAVFDLPGVWPTAGDGSIGLGVEKGEAEIAEWSMFVPR